MAWGASESISLVSALAAIVSAVYAGKTYLAAVALKKHDLELQLRLANETLRTTVGNLPDLLERAGRSRQAVLAATGLGRSGQMQAWEMKAVEIHDEIVALEKQLPDDGAISSRNLQELTTLIAATHALQQRASARRDELVDGLRDDDRQRDHIREDRRAAFAKGSDPARMCSARPGL